MISQLPQGKKPNLFIRLFSVCMPDYRVLPAVFVPPSCRSQFDLLWACPIMKAETANRMGLTLAFSATEVALDLSLAPKPVSVRIDASTHCQLKCPTCKTNQGSNQTEHWRWLSQGQPLSGRFSIKTQPSRMSNFPIGARYFSIRN